jgi:hypothetical protein
MGWKGKQDDFYALGESSTIQQKMGGNNPRRIDFGGAGKGGQSERVFGLQPL